MSENHGDHDHEHEGMLEDEELSPLAKRSLAMMELLDEKGILSAEDLQRRVTILEQRSPSDGARVVARAWTDPAFRARLLSDARPALEEMGYPVTTEAGLVVLENTESVHHMVVCTLCSCYPTTLLGPPPDWYKSLPYRSRAVVDPRSVMREFGFEPAEDVEVRVMDSTADLRYLVLPRRPGGTEDMSEEELEALVTRDSMIGVTDARSPEPARPGS